MRNRLWPSLSRAGALSEDVMPVFLVVDSGAEKLPWLPLAGRLRRRSVGSWAYIFGAVCPARGTSVALFRASGDTPGKTGMLGCPSWTLIEPCASLRSLILGASWKTFDDACHIGRATPTGMFSKPSSATARGRPRWRLRLHRRSGRADANRQLSIPSSHRNAAGFVAATEAEGKAGMSPGRRLVLRLSRR